MPIYIIIILIGIVAALIINFIPKAKDPSLEEDVIIPESEPETNPEQATTPELESFPKVDLPLPTGEAKIKTAQNKKKTSNKADTKKK